MPCSWALFVHWWLWCTFKIFSVFLPPFENWEDEPYSLRVSGSHTVFWAFPPDFGKPIWVHSLSGSYIHSEAAAVPLSLSFFYYSHLISLVLPNQYEQDKSAQSYVNHLHKATLSQALHWLVSESKDMPGKSSSVSLWILQRLSSVSEQPLQ